MDKADIAQHRLLNQQIAGTHFTAPAEIVHWLGAVQAQDYAMAKWAVASRIPGSTHQAIEEALNTGAIIRTHILRPTWHLVAANDIRWMLALTAPHLKRIAASLNRKLELEQNLFSKIFSLFIKALTGSQHLTRPELMTILNQAGIRTDDLRSTHIMFQAELEGIVCNGARREKQFTYALLDEQVPAGPQNFSRPEALAELANRYFTSHGPATLPDFAWWSGLNLTDARSGLEAAKAKLNSENIAGHTYWFTALASRQNPAPGCLYLLPAFDEFMVSYKERSASLDSTYAKAAITGNGIFKPILIINGRVAGTWKPIAKKSRIRVDIHPFNATEHINQELLHVAKQKYAAYLGANLETA